MPADCQKLKMRFESLVSDSSSFRSTCDDVEKYIMPRVGASDTQRKNGTDSSAAWKDPDVWDATASVALVKLAAHLHSSVTPHGLRWANFQFLDKKLQEDKAAAEWLEKNTDLIFQALEESDFYAEMSKGFNEYVGLGDMIVTQEVIEEKLGTFAGFDYTAIPIGEAEFEEDAKGRLKTLYRLLRWTAVQILDKFGEEGTPQAIKEQAAGPKGGSDRLDVIFCTFERPEVLAKPIREKVAAPDKRPYGFVYFLRTSGERLGEEGGYYEQPAYIARFECMPGSRWGQGLGHQSIPTVKGLSAYVEMFLTQAALALDPPMKSTERGLLSNIDRRPGGMTAVESIEDIAPLNDGNQARFDVGKIALEDLRAEVRRIFREDQLELKDSPQMTATEAQIRYDIMLKLMGPTLARLLSEFLSPMLLSAYRALFRAGKFEAPPPVVAQADAQIRIQYQSPMARARRTDEVASLERLAAFASGLLKMGFTEAGMVFDPSAALREVSKLLDCPVTVLRSKEEVKKLVAAQAQMQERLASAEAAKNEAAAAVDASSIEPAAGGGGVSSLGGLSGAFPYGPQVPLTPGGQVA